MKTTPEERAEWRRMVRAKIWIDGNITLIPALDDLDEALARAAQADADAHAAGYAQATRDIMAMFREFPNNEHMREAADMVERGEFRRTSDDEAG